MLGRRNGTLHGSAVDASKKTAPRSVISRSRAKCTVWHCDAHKTQIRSLWEWYCQTSRLRLYPAKPRTDSAICTIEWQRYCERYRVFRKSRARTLITQVYSKYVDVIPATILLQYKTLKFETFAPCPCTDLTRSHTTLDVFIDRQWKMKQGSSRWCRLWQPASSYIDLQRLMKQPRRLQRLVPRGAHGDELLFRGARHDMRVALPVLLDAHPRPGSLARLRGVVVAGPDPHVVSHAQKFAGGSEEVSGVAAGKVATGRAEVGHEQTVATENVVWKCSHKLRVRFAMLDVMTYFQSCSPCDRECAQVDVWQWPAVYRP